MVGLVVGGTTWLGLFHGEATHGNARSTARGSGRAAQGTSCCSGGGGCDAVQHALLSPLVVADHTCTHLGHHECALSLILNSSTIVTAVDDMTSTVHPRINRHTCCQCVSFCYSE